MPVVIRRFPPRLLHPKGGFAPRRRRLARHQALP
jgi:hypothetical protein